MSETEFSPSFISEPRSGRKLRQVANPFSEHASVPENRPVFETAGVGESPRYLERVGMVREGAPRRLVGVETEPGPELQRPSLPAPQSFVEATSSFSPAAPSWKPEEAFPLTREEVQPLPEDEHPHWGDLEAAQWEQEQEAERLAQRMETERATREEQARLEREQNERIALEKEAARREREEAERQARERAELARLKREEEAAEQARLQREREAAEEQARLQREHKEAEQLRLLHEREEADRLRVKQEREKAAEQARLEREQEEAARTAQEEAQKARRLRLKVAEAHAERARLDQVRLEQASLAREKEGEERLAQARADEEMRVLRSVRDLRDRAVALGTQQGASFLNQQKASLLVAEENSRWDGGDFEEPEAEENRLDETESEEEVDNAPQRPLRRLEPSGTPEEDEEPEALQEPEEIPRPLPPAVVARAPRSKEEENEAADLLELRLARLKKEHEVAKMQGKLLEAQAKVRRKAEKDPHEFNLGAWLAGAGAADLRECSDSERRKVSAVGLTVLVPTIFSLMSASYAASTLTDNAYVIGLVAFAWATIILLVDRAIIATYSPNMNFVSKVGVITLRFVVATLMGMTVSHPLTLLIFKDTITQQIEEQRDHEIAEAREKFATQKKGLEEGIAKVQVEVERQRQLYNASFEADVEKPAEKAGNEGPPGTLTAEEQTMLKQRTEDAAKPFRQELAGVETSLQAADARRTQLQTELDEWQRQFEAEIGGQRSGVSGIGPRARSIQTDQLEWRRADFKRLTEEVQSLSARRGEIQKSISASGDALRREMERVAAERDEQLQRDHQRFAGLQKQLQEKKMESLVSQGDTVRKQIQTSIDSGLADLTRLRAELTALTELELKRMDDLQNNPRRDMLTQTLAMHHMFEHPEAGGNFALAAYIVLAALFLAIDTMPILVKFTAKKGEFDERRERATALAAVPSDLRKHSPVDAKKLRALVLEYDQQEQQKRVYEMQARAYEEQEKAFDQQGKVHAKEKEVYEKEREAIHAKADKDAALTLKALELAERERIHRMELTDRERKLALAQQEAEIEKLELAAKEAEANEAKAKAHLSKLNLEIVQNDPKGLLKHQLQERQVERGRERFAKENGAVVEVAAAEANSSEEHASSVGGTETPDVEQA